MAEFRTYATFTVRFDDGASWSGYHTAEEAAASLACGSRTGKVVSKVWTVEVEERRAHIYQPGLSPEQAAAALLLGEGA